MSRMPFDRSVRLGHDVSESEDDRIEQDTFKA
jgi:hypothetical protein